MSLASILESQVQSLLRPGRSSDDVVVLSSTDRIDFAILIMREKGLHSCPLRDPNNQQIVGIIDMLDIASFLAEHVSFTAIFVLRVLAVRLRCSHVHRSNYGVRTATKAFRLTRSSPICRILKKS
jgi:CBS domain-containing protein